jgi:hypothetical protein
LLNTLNELKTERIWNFDETSFCLDASKTRVVGAKNVAATRVTQGSGRENTSVLMSCNAAGEKGPPLIIFKGKRVWDKWVGENLTSLEPLMPQLKMVG